VLYDKDESRRYSNPTPRLQERFFFEIVPRGGDQGYGAPIRLAAPARMARQEEMPHA
jgi:4-hydroxyphenylpyruvate dioxygenase-like putative hemolysin